MAVPGKPYFPSVENGAPYRSTTSVPPPIGELRPSRPSGPVVTRPEPPPESKAPVAKGAPKLSKDEVRALLAVSEQNSRASMVYRRARWIVVPTGLISLALEHLLGDYANVVVGLFCLASFAYTAWPLLRRNDWS